MLNSCPRHSAHMTRGEPPLDLTRSKKFSRRCNDLVCSANESVVDDQEMEAVCLPYQDRFIICPD